MSRVPHLRAENGYWGKKAFRKKRSSIIRRGRNERAWIQGGLEEYEAEGLGKEREQLSRVGDEPRLAGGDQGAAAGVDRGGVVSA